MCTEQTRDQVVVCDVAVADVRRLVGDLPGVVLTHLPYEGTRVANLGGTTTGEFRQALGQALELHGGALAP